jgi:general secretion pathway protein I
LLEVLMAFSILALSLGVLMRIFGGDGRLAGLAGEHSRAVVLAESLLAGAGGETPLQVGQTSGAIDEHYSWVMRVMPFTPEGEPLPEQIGFKPFWVEVTVAWGEDDESRSFSLGTLRLAGDNNGPRFGAAPAFGGGFGPR